MGKLLAVMIGGAIGAGLRFWLSAIPGRYSDGDFPWGTLLVNVLGCFVMGVMYISAEKKLLPSNMQALVTTGILGALTTYSTFALDKYVLVEAGKMPTAFLYLMATLAAGFAALYGGVAIGRLLFSA